MEGMHKVTLSNRFQLRVGSGGSRIGTHFIRNQKVEGTGAETAGG